MEMTRNRWIGYGAMLGGIAALVLAPLMVAIKYMTGWAIIPEPFWVPAVEGWLAAIFPRTSAPALWAAFGTAWSIALLLMLIGLVGLRSHLEGRTWDQKIGYWLLTGGLLLVLPGDATHSWTWHQNGLTVPTPGTNPLANTAYAVHMMGMNFVMAGSLLLGVTALRRRTLARWTAVALALVFPSAVLASISLLPTTPSGALWLFSLLMIACGWLVGSGRASRLAAT